MTKVNKSWDFTEIVTNKTDEYVNKFYDEKFINKFLDFWIVKTILKNSIFVKIDWWFVKNITLITQILWWLWIVSWILMILSPLQLLLSFFSYWNLTFSIVTFAWKIALSLLAFISWIWFLKMKKWLPFITIVLFIVSIAFNIIINILKFTLPFYSLYGMHSNILTSVIIWLLISFSLHLIYTCLIVNNKNKFNK